MTVRTRSMSAVLAAGLLLAACGGETVGEPAADSGSSTPDTTAAESAHDDAFDAEEYFAGRTIRMIVPHSPGGNTDIFSRFVADRLAQNIPGTPTISVTNSDGLGGIANIFDATEEDLVIGVTSRSSALYGTADAPEASHVPDEIQVIGGVAGDSRAWTTFGDAAEAYSSLADASGSDGPSFRFAATVGSPQEIESDVLLYSWLCDNMDLSCEFINVADDSSADTNLMVQRGEVNLQGGTMITMMRDYLDPILDGTSRLLIEYAQRENDPIPLPDGVESEDVLEALPEDVVADYERIVPAISSGLLGTMVWAGPQLPTPVLETLQEAFRQFAEDDEAVRELNTIMAGGESPYEYRVLPLVGDEAQEAFDTSAGIFADNKEYITGLREQYWENDWS